jgi:hypothetical protein
MKKKNLKSLKLEKSTVSNLNKNEIQAGLAIYTYFFQCGTNYQQCGTGPQTIACTGGAACTFNSKDRCQTIEVDAFTRPIC